MNYDLTERYIYAATRRLPGKQREDVAQELRGLIDDMLTERCGEGTPTEKDVRVVLTELGTPQELCAQYDENGKKCLIGQPYYSSYIFVLKIILLCSAFGLTLAAVMMQIMEPQAWYAALGSWLAMLWNGVMGAFAFTTALYAFFYHKGVQLTEPFNFDDLPPVPKRRQEISRWECIAGIVFCVIFTVLFLAVPQVIVYFVDGQAAPLFDVSALRETWYIIVAFAACGIIRETVRLLEGRYNRRVLTVTLVVNVISAVLSVWWLAGFELLHPDFLANITAIFENDTEFFVNLFGNIQSIFLAVMLAALVLDSVEAAVKTLRK